jgi:hypothetical protein
MLVSFPFWNKYVEANELERHNLLETLPLFKGMDKKSGTVKTILSATLLQSYFDELINYMELKNEKNTANVYVKRTQNLKKEYGADCFKKWGSKGGNPVLLK